MKIKQSEVNAALQQPGASRNVKELEQLRKELRAAKSLFNSISSRKVTDDVVADCAKEASKELKSVALGGIIKKCVMLQLYGADKLGKEYSKVNSWVYNITSAVDRLIGEMLNVIKLIHNPRVQDMTRQLAISEMRRALNGVVSLINRKEVQAKMGKALAIVAANTETETADDVVDTAITADSAETHTDAPQTARTAQMIKSTTETVKRGETSENGSQEHSTITTTTQTPGITYYVDSEYRDAI